jgi:serine/threonine protein kinase
MAEIQPIASNSEVPHPLSGTAASRFIIGERLGGGGMGEVYRAEDILLKRVVALKRLASSLRADPIYRLRFQQESNYITDSQSEPEGECENGNAQVSTGHTQHPPRIRSEMRFACTLQNFRGTGLIGGT